MKYKLALDFQFTRFWAFSLLAVVITSAVAYNSFQMAGRFILSTIFLWVSVVLFFVWVFFMIWFLRVYLRLRSKLRD